MSEFIRQTMLEDSYLDTHKFKPEVYYNRINGREYQIKLVYSGKEAILTEKMKNGLTELVTVEYLGDPYVCKSFYEAELKANEYLKG